MFSDHRAAGDHVGDDVDAVQPGRHIAPIPDLALDESEMLDRIIGRDIGIAGERPARAFDRKDIHPFDELFAFLTIGDELGDRQPPQPVLFGEVIDLRPGHDAAVVIGEFADDADRRQAGKPAKIDRGLGMTRAHEDPALAGDQREDMPGPDEIAGAHIAIGKRAHRIGALFGGNAGRQPMPDIDRNREGGAERRVIGRDHRLEMQPPRIFRGNRRADDAARIADDEAHLFGRAERRGADEIGLVFAVVVIGDDDDLAARNRLDRFGHRTAHSKTSTMC